MGLFWKRTEKDWLKAEKSELDEVVREIGSLQKSIKQISTHLQTVSAIGESLEKDWADLTNAVRTLHRTGESDTRRKKAATLVKELQERLLPILRTVLDHTLRLSDLADDMATLEKHLSEFTFMIEFSTTLDVARLDDHFFAVRPDEYVLVPLTLVPVRTANDHKGETHGSPGKVRVQIVNGQPVLSNFSGRHMALYDWSKKNFNSNVDPYYRKKIVDIPQESKTGVPIELDKTYDVVVESKDKKEIWNDGNRDTGYEVYSVVSIRVIKT